MDTTELRKQIDEVDKQMFTLIKKRMELVEGVAQYKKEHNLPTTNKKREREVLTNVTDSLGSDLGEYGRAIYRTMFDVSKLHEAHLICEEYPLYQRIQKMISARPVPFPKCAVVACQGCEGSYSQIATERLFEVPNITFNNSFEGVFKAVSCGLCEYGIVPIENSTAGSVNEIYDKLSQYNINIVRSVRVKINHSLLAKKGAKLEDIKIIYTHQQAINQCTQFLEGLKDVTIIPCENTAMAAKKVFEEKDKGVASISAHICADIYGLEALAENIQNQENNYTRFICISKEDRIFPGADRTSIMMVLQNKPGSLYSVLSKFNVIGANLLKLESRPIPNRDFNFVFYFDVEASIYDNKFASLLCELQDVSEDFRYFGTYTEII